MVSTGQFELQEKPSDVRKDYFCTLKSDFVSIDSCKADDNGSHGKHGNAKHIFQVTFRCTGDIKSVQNCRVDKNGSYTLMPKNAEQKYLSRHLPAQS